MRRALLMLVLVFVTCPAITARAERERTDFDQTVLSCEEALAKLERCCPGFDVLEVACVDEEYDTEGCGVRTYGRQLPAYRNGESVCIREMPCEGLVERRVCERAQAVRQRGKSTSVELDGGDTRVRDDDAQPTVCP